MCNVHSLYTKSNQKIDAIVAVVANIDLVIDILFFLFWS